MFTEILDILTASELTRLKALAETAAFADGRVSNPHSTVKNNAHVQSGGPADAEASALLAAALQRNEVFRNAVFPKLMARPQLTKYSSGANYGLHSDAAFLPIGGRPIRTDLSCTIFISDPEEYEGGVLCVNLGTRRVEAKGPAGSAIIYPSNTLHEVTPVQSGQRIVGLTFIESHIADQQRREILYELNEVAALEGLTMKWENFTRLQRVQMSLLRLWSNPE